MSASNLHTELAQMSKLSTATSTNPSSSSRPAPVAVDLIAALYTLPDPTLPTKNTPCAKQYSNNFVAFRSLFASLVVARYVPAATRFLGLISREAGRRWRLIKNTPLEDDWTAYAARSMRECPANPRSRANRRRRARDGVQQIECVHYETSGTTRSSNGDGNDKGSNSASAQLQHRTQIGTSYYPRSSSSPYSSSSSFTPSSRNASFSPESYRALELSHTPTNFVFPATFIPPLESTQPSGTHYALYLDYSVHPYSQESLSTPSLGLFALDGHGISSYTEPFFPTDTASLDFWDSAARDLTPPTSRIIQHADRYDQWAFSSEHYCSFDPHAKTEV